MIKRLLPRKQRYIANSVDTIFVNGEFGGSSIILKSYDQGRKSFQGTEMDLILLDEEPPMDVYSECMIRS